MKLAVSGENSCTVKIHNPQCFLLTGPRFKPLAYILSGRWPGVVEQVVSTHRLAMKNQVTESRRMALQAVPDLSLPLGAGQALQVVLGNNVLALSS